MVQDRALRQAGGARRVLDLCRVGRADPRQALGGRAARAELLPVAEQHNLAQPGQFAAHGVQQVSQGRAAVPRDQEDPVRLRLAEHVGQLFRAQRRVHGDDRNPGQPRGELEQDPFRNVVGPDRDAFAGLEAAQERPRRSFGLLEYLGVGPAPAVGRAGGALDQGGRLGGVGHGLAQQLTDRHVQDRR